MDCLGIPVVFDPLLKNISEARGLWHWKKIFVGPPFFKFSAREQGAFLLHEVGHCKFYHLEKRLLRLWLLLWPPSLWRYLRDQEYQADAFAAHCGYGVDLACAFSRLRNLRQRHWYPDFDSRIARLLACSKG